jgi:hypothetical protein
VKAVGQARDIARSCRRFERRGRSPGSGRQIGGLVRRDDQVIGIGPAQKARSRGDVGDRGGGGRGVEDGDGGQASGQGTVRRGPGHQEEAGLPRKAAASGMPPPSVGARFLRGGERVDPDEPQAPISSRTSPVMTGETR